MQKKTKPLNRKCVICGTKFQTYDLKVRWCCPDCGAKFAMKVYKRQREKNAKDIIKKEKKRLQTRKMRLKTRADWLRDAQKVFNEYIRLRDADKPCISCGRYHTGQWHAGHYRSVGAAPELRFNEDNVHKQCQPCNTHKSGNAVEYRISLIRKIGVERVEFLERKDHPPLKLDVDEIKALIKTYKAKVKALKQERGL